MKTVRSFDLGKVGRNSLDFVLGYRRVGIESAADPNGCFHVVSCDTGFDDRSVYFEEPGFP